MAMKLCRECNKEISSLAKKCPHCGIDKPFGDSAAVLMMRAGCALIVLPTLLLILAIFVIVIIELIT